MCLCFCLNHFQSLYARCKMFQTPITSLFRALAPSCKYAVQRNLCRFTLPNYTLQRNCLPLVERTRLLINRVSQPLGVGLLQQRFASQATKETTATRENNNASVTASEGPEVNQSGEEENDILYKRVQIEARSGDRAVLDSYEKFVSMSANYLGITVSRVWQPFRTIKRRTLLRASFVKKKYRVQYEWRTYYRCMEFKHLTGSTADTLLEYIERNLPEGVALKVTRQRIEEIPAHLVPPA